MRVELGPQLLAQPLRFDSGAIVLEPGFSTALDRNTMDTLSRERCRFGPVRSAG